MAPAKSYICQDRPSWCSLRRSTQKTLSAPGRTRAIERRGSEPFIASAAPASLRTGLLLTIMAFCHARGADGPLIRSPQLGRNEKGLVSIIADDRTVGEMVDGWEKILHKHKLGSLSYTGDMKEARPRLGKLGTTLARVLAAEAELLLDVAAAALLCWYSLDAGTGGDSAAAGMGVTPRSGKVANPYSRCGASESCL